MGNWSIRHQRSDRVTLGEHTIVEGKGGTGAISNPMFMPSRPLVPPRRQTIISVRGAQAVDLTNADTKATFSGTTEDLMGKNLASDDHSAANCVAEGFRCSV